MNCQSAQHYKKLFTTSELPTMILRSARLEKQLTRHRIDIKTLPTLASDAKRLSDVEMLLMFDCINKEVNN